MKSNQKITIKSMIMLLIVILIPLLGAFFIGTYSYNRYIDDFFYEYMNDIEDDTIAKFEGYIKYASMHYEKEPIFEVDVQKDDERVLTVAVYRSIVGYEDMDNSGNIIEYRTIVYHFLAYNINYQKLIEIKDPTGEIKLRYNQIPSIYIRLIDVANSDNTDLMTLDIPAGVMMIEDYNSSPEVDSRGEPLNSRYLKSSELVINPNFSKDIDIHVFMSEDASSSNPIYHQTITKFTLNDVERNVDTIDLSGFNKGFSGSEVNAGYFTHVFKLRIWWQSLIAFILLGFVTFSFYIVWQAEEANVKVKTQNVKRERKK